MKRRGFDTYSDYLSSSVWADVRARYFKSGRSAACLCGATDIQLHHLTYERVGGDELPDDLEPLCAKCHALVHVLERRGLITLDLEGFALDPARARLHRERAIRRERDRRLKRDLFHHLPLHTRLARLQRAQVEHGGPIWRDLRAIEFMLRKAERKVDGLSDAQYDRFDERLRGAEEVLTDAKPDALDDLVALQSQGRSDNGDWHRPPMQVWETPGKPRKESSSGQRRNQ